MLTSIKVNRVFEASVHPMNESARQNRPAHNFVMRKLFSPTDTVIEVYLVGDELFADFLHTWNL